MAVEDIETGSRCWQKYMLVRGIETERCAGQGERDGRAEGI